MLSAADFASFDLSGLSSGLQNLVVRHDRYRREAASIGVSPDCPETYSLVQAAKRDAEVLADAERLVALVRQLAADKGSGRPAATSPNAQGLMARALAAISGAPPARHCRTLKRESERGALSPTTLHGSDLAIPGVDHA